MRHGAFVVCLWPAMAPPTAAAPARAGLPPFLIEDLTWPEVLPGRAGSRRRCRFRHLPFMLSPGQD